ncbi:hypothetical protein CUMW_031130 [Citrus unshiu]|nr:hypothetical protein CUMW_031130 [Citrus unshiu]
MFSYINLYGKYPPGLFASECLKGKRGLECPASAPTQSANADHTSMIAIEVLEVIETLGGIEITIYK